MEPDFEKRASGHAAAGSIDLDELLEHRGFLQSLVRHIIADEQGVEDVLQETWVKALERPPGAVDSLRAWLARVARNLALNRVRGAKRGAERERRSARPELIDGSALDTAEKLERQTQILSSVARLGEPRRTAIHLRYFEGKTPAEIAVVTDVAVSTVHERLRSGRRELRGELERALGIRVKDRGFLGLYLLPLAGLSEQAMKALQIQIAATAAAGAGATATLAPPVLGGVLMSKKVLIAAAVLVCAAGIHWTIDGAGSPAQAEPSGPLDAQALVNPVEPDLAAEEIASAPAVEEEEGEVRESVAPVATITGEVRNRSDELVAGVTLHARIWNGYEPDGEADFDVTMTSDDAGAFRWSPERPEGAFVVHVQPADEAYEGYGDQELVLPGSAVRALGVRVFPLDSALTGFVRDIDGNPIEGATVRSGAETTTDAQGAFVLPASSYGLVYASAPGFASQREVFEPPSTGQARLDFVLIPEFQVFGRITDEAGMPVEGVVVTTFYSQGKGNEGISDADGFYELGGLEPGRERHSLYARRDGYTETALTVETVPEMRFEQDLVMKVGTRVEGRVVGPKGEPLAGASLYIGFSPNAYDRLDATSDGEGRFVFPNVKPGKQTIGTHFEGFAPDLTVFHLEEGTAVFAELEIVLQEGRSIEGMVTGPDHEPIENVRVGARYKGDWIENSARTGVDGVFVLDGLPPTDIELSFYRPGYARLRWPLPDHDDDAIDVAMRLAGKMAGRVIDGITGEPLTHFTIRLLQPNCPNQGHAGLSATWVREGHAFTSEDGSWDTGTDILEPGSVIKIEATAAGYGAGVLDCVRVETDSDPDAHVIALFAGSRVTGRVVDRDGAPLAGAVIKRGKTSWINPNEPHDVQLVRTGPDGEFTLDDVPPGATTLLVQHERWKREFRDGPFEVRAGIDSRREITIGPGATISGIALDPEGKPLASATIELIGESRQVIGDQHETTRTDADGRFAFEDLPDGRYMIEVAKGERLIAPFRMIVPLTGGVSHDIVLGAASGSATLKGTIECTEAVPDLPVWVMLMPASFPDVTEPLPSWGVVAVDGVFELHGLPAGDYRLMVEHRTETAPPIVYRGAGQCELETNGTARAIVPVEVRR